MGHQFMTKIRGFISVELNQIKAAKLYDLLYDSRILINEYSHRLHKGRKSTDNIACLFRRNLPWTLCENKTESIGP